MSLVKVLFKGAHKLTRKNIFVTKNSFVGISVLTQEI